MHFCAKPISIQSCHFEEAVKSHYRFAEPDIRHLEILHTLLVMIRVKDAILLNIVASRVVSHAIAKLTIHYRHEDIRDR